jgi:hypothetical protein
MAAPFVVALACEADNLKIERLAHAKLGPITAKQETRVLPLQRRDGKAE